MNPLSPSSQPRRKEIRQFNEDVLSCLPDNVIDNILNRLNPRDAVRTSALSYFWRYKWTHLTNVCFTFKDFPRRENQSQMDYDRKVVRMIDIFLLLHEGPIHLLWFFLDLYSCEAIDRWVISLSRKGIKDLFLVKLGGPRYKVHSSIFSCDLGSLYLIHPASFTGYKSLTNLCLITAEVSDIGLESLISNCPLLRVLTLKFIYGCSHLKICAKKLVKLEVQSAFRDICLEAAPVLTEASIKLLNTDGESHGSTNGATCKIIGCLSHIRRLELLDSTLPVLTAGDVPVRLPTACSRLSYLSLDLNFGDMQEILVAFCIFRSSPVLQKVDIQSTACKNIEMLSLEDFWRSGADFNCTFSQLQIINFNDFTGSTSELKFLEYLLGHAPILEKVQIRLKEYTADLVKILKECNQFLRTSSKAAIVFPD